MSIAFRFFSHVFNQFQQTSDAQTQLKPKPKLPRVTIRRNIVFFKFLCSSDCSGFRGFRYGKSFGYNTFNNLGHYLPG